MPPIDFVALSRTQISAGFECRTCGSRHDIPAALLGPPLVCPHCKTHLVRTQPVRSQPRSRSWFGR